jgi:hypothetical protein
MEKTIQGISESKEKTNPNVPAVDGISIRIAASKPCPTTTIAASLNGIRSEVLLTH